MPNRSTKKLAGATGLEPAQSALTVRCTTDCATPLLAQKFCLTRESRLCEDGSAGKPKYAKCLSHRPKGLHRGAESNGSPKPLSAAIVGAREIFVKGKEGQEHKRHMGTDIRLLSPPHNI